MDETSQPARDAGKPARPASAGIEENLFAALPAPYNSADYSHGRRTFKLCGSCHTVVQGGRDLVGPNLHGVFGRTVGSRPGFAYSQALQEADFDWTAARLEEWLANPRSYLPGNNMSFAGVRRPEDRHAVIAYLMLESGYTAEEADGGEATPAELAPDD